MRVLAVDPGGTTGWARWDSGRVSWGQIPGGLLGSLGLDAMLHEMSFGGREYVDTKLVIERYTIGARTAKFSRQSDALQITGHLRAEAHQIGVETVMQQPSEAMRLFTDERLRQFGWWARGEGHARDALRHLGLYLAKRRLVRLTDGSTESETEGQGRGGR